MANTTQPLRADVLRGLLDDTIELQVFEEVGSTNDVAKSALRATSAARPSARRIAPQAVVAARQGAGRGRLGRSWSSPAGGVYLSLALAVPAGPERLGAVSLVAAVATRRALAGLVEGLLIKWPNDIVAVKGKAAGILAESSPLCPSGAQGLVVGVGVNVGACVNVGLGGQHLPSTACCLSDLPAAPGTSCSREEVSALVINSLLRCLGDWHEAGFSFSPFIQEYEQYHILANKQVCVRSPDGMVLAEGLVQGVGLDGQLLVENAAAPLGVCAVTVGEATLQKA
ncbi:MAG: biotin--[acetyl-CoA-carboxylase] ligase [Coriobacteriales bacterium]|jgi:BirA family biotin operon repressor/biotin-[acetyl-CoA-carboxylase] ligase|nr:biotin--[acetyl-CoA-carboxylase] ligase [Coriobacteriales bacterium]